MIRQLVCLTLIVFVFVPQPAIAQQAPLAFRVHDTPNDAGESLTVSWSAVRSDVTYRLSLATSRQGPFHRIGTVTPATGKIDDDRYVVVVEDYTQEGATRPIVNGVSYTLRLDALTARETIFDLASGEATSSPNWFHSEKLTNFLLGTLFSVLVIGYIGLARRRDLTIRRLGGLEALDEALGRATEMGKPVLFIHGLHDMNSVSTIAAVNVLSQLARRAAEFGTRLMVANRYPIVMSVSQEVVREASADAGRPDAYNEQDVFFAAADQFSYAATLDGLMVREKPAANIMMGYFYAESLLLAETGSSTGAIQIAGTDAYTQLPFFVTTCDYTLMGEELYAASAYLSRDPKLLGSLKAQDVGKAAIVAVLVLGTVLSSFGITWVHALLASA